METKYIAAVVVIIFIALFAAGALLTGQGIDIAGCNANWKTIDTTVAKSDLCSADSCVATPAAQQHNAIVDGLLCACGRASAVQYSDATTNARIEEVVREYFGYSLGVQQICGSEGQQFLARRAYG